MHLQNQKLFGHFLLNRRKKINIKRQKPKSTVSLILFKSNVKMWKQKKRVRKKSLDEITNLMISKSLTDRQWILNQNRV